MRLMIAGGGTGGHLYPGIALAEELKARDESSEVLFVGTRRGIEARVLPELGWPHEFIEVSGLKTHGMLSKVRAVFRIPKAMWQSWRIIRNFRPDVVFGVGGYASGPMVLVARLTGTRTAILEQNSIPGLANKILGKVVHRIFLAFEETKRFFHAKKISMSGNPIRADIRAALAGIADADGKNDALHLFVFGGSQGATAVNQLIVGAMVELKKRNVPISIVHQTGKLGFDETVKAYGEAGIDAECRVFIEDMASEYQRADLVVARSGATTIAELAVVGRPAILVPYPYAADNHQEINAAEMVKAGAAQMLDQHKTTPEELASTLEKLYGDSNALLCMGSAMKALGRPEAAATIIDWCEDQAGANVS